MSDTLKAAGRIGAELGAAKAEVEKLRGLLREAAEDIEAWGAYASEYFQEKHDLAGCAAKYRAAGVGDQGDGGAELAAIAAMPMRTSLSKQPEPTDTYTAVDMDTAAAQGFRDGQAAVEPAPAQDERLRAAFMEGYQQGIDSEFSDPEAAWNRSRSIHVALDLEQARPAQTEQQPVAYANFNEMELCLHKPADGAWTPVYAAPIARTAPQPEQSGLVEALRIEALGLCDVVEKINSLSPVTYALQAGRAINKVRDAAAALSAQWTAEP